MRWKTNYWTLLFAIATAFALYLQFSKGGASPSDGASTPVVVKSTELPNEIDSTTAHTEMAAWDSLRAEFIIAINGSQTLQGDAKYVARGFNIPAVDMLDIIATMAPNTSVLGMLGIRDTAITMIFQVLDKSSELRYYDFTQPCPNYCDN